MGVVLIATLAFGLITPPYGLVLLMASKFVGVRFSQALRAALSDLCRFSHNNSVHDLFPVGCVVVAEASSAGFGRLFPQSERPGYICPP
jgi:hypothetical protein